MAGLLDAQPMGFWSPQSLVADARRHGVVVKGPCINASGSGARLERCAGEASNRPEPSAGGAAVRIGLSYVRGIGDEVALRIAAGQPYSGMEDVVGRAGLSAAQVEALAMSGAFACFGVGRREGLWAAEPLVGAASPAARPSPAVRASPAARLSPAVRASPAARAVQLRLPGLVVGADAPSLPAMNEAEEMSADLWAVGLSPGRYPTELVREELVAAGVVSAAGLAEVPSGEKVKVAGVVTHRQRPATAQGVTFMNLEDETGLMNVICSPGIWLRYRRVVRSGPALVVQGRLERVESVVNVVAERIGLLDLHLEPAEPTRPSQQPTRPSRALRSRDFR